MRPTQLIDVTSFVLMCSTSTPLFKTHNDVRILPLSEHLTVYYMDSIVGYYLLGSRELWYYEYIIGYTCIYVGFFVLAGTIV